MSAASELQEARERKEAAWNALCALDDAAVNLRKCGMMLQAKEVDILAGLVDDKHTAEAHRIERLQKLANQETEEQDAADFAAWKRSQ